MKSVSFFITILTLSCYFTASGQYTETLNNNSPGRSQVAFSLGPNVLHFEIGFCLWQEHHSLLQLHPDAFAVDFSSPLGFWNYVLSLI